MKRKRCFLFRKTVFYERKRAVRALMRIISHTTENMFDLHVYKCPNELIGAHFHVGHISYFEKSQKEKTNETIRIQQTIPTTGN